MEQSFALLQTDIIDLMQIHNLLDWQTHLPTLRHWKEAGRIRYIGITHYTASAYEEVEAVLKAEPVDFLQINYALDDRGVEKRLLPLCRERGVAVICNRPFGGGGLLAKLKDKPLPGWAAQVGVKSWPQLALKFLLSHSAVTCVIPGTGNPRYMAENARAGFGPTLTDAQRQQLIALVG
jgi:aryl-alcohol dehydrogenase-like predicted oxidoreductase